MDRVEDVFQEAVASAARLEEVTARSAVVPVVGEDTSFGIEVVGPVTLCVRGEEPKESTPLGPRTASEPEAAPVADPRSGAMGSSPTLPLIPPS